MIAKQNPELFEEIGREAGRFIAGGVVSLNRKVQPHIIFKRGKGMAENTGC